MGGFLRLPLETLLLPQLHLLLSAKLICVAGGLR
jgi:hypothetical protein